MVVGGLGTAMSYVIILIEEQGPLCSGMTCVGIHDIHTMELLLKWNVMFALIQLLILSRTNFTR